MQALCHPIFSPPQKHSDERQLSQFAAVLIFNQSSVFCIQVFREKKGHDEDLPRITKHSCMVCAVRICG